MEPKYYAEEVIEHCQSLSGNVTQIFLARDCYYLSPRGPFFPSFFTYPMRGSRGISWPPNDCPLEIALASRPMNCQDKKIETSWIIWGREGNHKIIPVLVIGGRDSIITRRQYTYIYIYLPLFTRASNICWANGIIWAIGFRRSTFHAIEKIGKLDHFTKRG